MGLTRHFLDWSQPALPAAVDFLCARYRRGNVVDMEQVIIVVPGSRAGRLLRDLLVTKTRDEQLALLPPVVETVSYFPEQLYLPKRPFANNLTQLLAWQRALRETPPDMLQRFATHRPAADDFPSWFGLARLLWQLHRELAADSLNFQDVARQGSVVPGFREQERWQALRDIQQRYLRILDELELWDQQTARLYAIDQRECGYAGEVVLVGTVDLNQAVREMLDQIADRVTALVFAPPDFAARFDSHGCVIPAAWTEAELPVALDQVRVTAGPTEQADAVSDILRSYGGAYRADEIVVGVPDETLLPTLTRRLTENGVLSRWVVGQNVLASTPLTLLQSLATFLDGRHFRDFAAAVRHPDLYDWLSSRTGGRDWLAVLDLYRSNHLQSQLGEWLGDPQEYGILAEVQTQLDEVLAPLAGHERRPLGEWADRISHVLGTIYAIRKIDRASQEDYYFQQAVQQLRDGLLDMKAVPRDLSPTIDASSTIELLLEQLASGQITSRAIPGAIDLLGWLELPWDLAPVLIVTSFNDGIVPSSRNADQFLPNALRSRLGLADNARRFARDAYALGLLLASRQQLTLVVGRHDQQGNPLAPSRLLFNCPDEALAARVLSLFQEPPTRRRSWNAPEPARPAFTVPAPQPTDRRPARGEKQAAPIEAVSVTGFRTYLECPYRFYLKHVLYLESRDDQAEELDAATFGSLIHALLERFGKNPINQSTDPEEIFAFLRAELAQLAEEWFGAERMPAVEVQLYQLAARLEAFAQWQADWTRQGWIIQRTEICEYPQTPRIVVGKRALRLKGRIDRLDYNSQTDAWMVFDYKTSEQAKKPDAVHRRKGQWVDLQLPLYRHLVRCLGIDAPVGLGYILLPKDTAQVGAAVADWSEVELAEADRTAATVAEKILDGVFWPPQSLGPNSDFAAICQEGVLGRLLETT